MHIKSMITSIVLVAAYSSPPYALGSVQSVAGPNGAKWTAKSKIIGQTSTGTSPSIDDPNTTPGGGHPIYFAPNNRGYSGVVGLLMTVEGGDTFTCSGTLVGDRSVVTAGHCVSTGGGIKAPDVIRTQVFFQDDTSSNLDERVFGIPTGNLPAGVTMIDVSNYAVNSGFTGATVDQNDIAVLTLAQIAPAYAQRYEIYTEDLTGKQFNVTGYGVRSSVGGAEGETPPYDAATGYRRQGANVYDFAWGDEAFNGFYTGQGPDDDWYLGSAEIEYSFVADFDNGLRAQDGSCLFAQEAGLSAADADRRGFCTLGVGDLEAGIAGGDSGGGAFIDGRLASVTSYGLGADDMGDLGNYPNSGFGEMNGYVPIFIHANFIRNAIAAVPEPATWTQMLLGFALIGAATRSRRKRSVAVA